MNRVPINVEGLEALLKHIPSGSELYVDGNHVERIYINLDDRTINLITYKYEGPAS